VRSFFTCEPASPTGRKPARKAWMKLSIRQSLLGPRSNHHFWSGSGVIRVVNVWRGGLRDFTGLSGIFKPLPLDFVCSLQQSA